MTRHSSEEHQQMTSNLTKKDAHLISNQRNANENLNENILLPPVVLKTDTTKC